MKRVLVLLVVTIVLLVSPLTADPVIDWDATAVTVMLRVPTLARSILHDLAYLHIAMYDAVNAIDRQYSSFAVTPPNAKSWASQEAAVAAAARRVLVTLYPSQQIYIDSVYTAAIKGLTNGSATNQGIAIGDTVAALYLALRTGDGRDANLTYTWKAAGPGVYLPTPPGAAAYQPVGMFMGELRPFALASVSRFCAPDPPSLLSDQYLRAFKEVKRFGSRDSSFTTAEQREIARFWAENPNVFLSRNIREIARQRQMTLPDNARFFAQVYATIGDALIAGFNSKYLYNYWRPVTAIRQADADRNPVTDADTSWMPLVTTPTHPEYPAAHGCGTGGLAFALEEFFGTTDVPLTLTSTVTGTQHTFTNTNDLVEEVANARVWGGMHFRTSVDAGTAIARDVAAAVQARFVPVVSLPWTVQYVQGLAYSRNPAIGGFSAPDESVSWGFDEVNEQFVRTIDGGIHWAVSAVQGAAGLQGRSIYALDGNTAWMAMGDFSGGGVFKTTDGGATWTRQATAYPKAGGQPVQIHFFDADNGVVVGNPRNGTWEVYTTTNGGAQWEVVPSIPAPVRNEDETFGSTSASFGNSYWFGTHDRSVYRSTDRGKTWSVVRDVPAAGGVGVGVAFRDSLHGLAVSYFVEQHNRVSRTTDGGVTWVPYPSSVVPETPSAYFIANVPGTRQYMITSHANIGFPYPTVAGLALTEDEGVTWKMIDNVPRSRVAFASNQVGWTGGLGGTIYKWDISATTSTQAVQGIATDFRLEQNYPNPFNPSTVIRFTIPAGVSGDVTLRVYDVLGQEVKTLVNDKLQPGSYETTFDANGLAGGAYFCRLTAGKFVQVRRLLLIK